MRDPAAGDRHYAEHGERSGDDLLAIQAVGQKCQRHTERRIDDGETRSRQQTERTVAEMELGLDLRQKDRKNLAIQVIDDIDKRQDDKHGSAAALRHESEGLRERRNRQLAVQIDPIVDSQNANLAETLGLSWTSILRLPLRHRRFERPA